MLYRDVNDLLDADPRLNHMSDAAQALGSRWLALDRSETPSGPVRTGLRKAWLDRERWPAALQTRLAEHRVERATRFIGGVLWERWEAERIARERTGDLAPPRVSDARIALYRDCAAAWQRRRQWPAAMLRHVASWYAALSS